MSDRDERQPIARVDHRSPPPDAVRREPYFECTYFFVSGASVDLLVTMTFLGRVDGRATAKLPAARVIALARTADGRWAGGIEEVPPDAVVVPPRRNDFAMGASALRFVAGAYALDVQVDAGRIAAHLRLRPLGDPAVGRSVRTGAPQWMRWVAAPRLAANGEITIAGETHPIARASAYYDRTCGAFSWGGDFAWEWGLVLGSDDAPWTIAYSRISDRARLRRRSQTILLWRAGVCVATFLEDEMTVLESGFVRGGARLRVPPLPSASAPTTSADVPFELVAHGRNELGHVALRFFIRDFAEIAIPNGRRDRGSTLLCEGSARAHVEGVIHGEHFQFDATGLLELNHAARAPRPVVPLGSGSSSTA